MYEFPFPGREVKRTAAVDGAVQGMRHDTQPGGFCLWTGRNNFLGNMCERRMLAYAEMLTNPALELCAPGIRVVLGMQSTGAHPKLD